MLNLTNHTKPYTSKLISYTSYNIEASAFGGRGEHPPPAPTPMASKLAIHFEHPFHLNTGYATEQLTASQIDNRIFWFLNQLHPHDLRITEGKVERYKENNIHQCFRRNSYPYASYI